MIFLTVVKRLRTFGFWRCKIVIVIVVRLRILLALRFEGLKRLQNMGQIDYLRKRCSFVKPFGTDTKRRILSETMYVTFDALVKFCAARDIFSWEVSRSAAKKNKTQEHLHYRLKWRKTMRGKVSCLRKQHDCRVPFTFLSLIFRCVFNKMLNDGTFTQFHLRLKDASLTYISLLLFLSQRSQL